MQLKVWRVDPTRWFVGKNSGALEVKAFDPQLTRFGAGGKEAVRDTEMSLAGRPAPG
jgi:hypothetical protein